MASALVVGGTRFIGRHTVTEFADHGYDVTLFNRGQHENPFEDDDRVDHVEGDRTERTDLKRAAETEPDVVVDCVAYHPGEVRAATEVFGDAGVDAYVLVSSTAAYDPTQIPRREGGDLLPFSEEQAADDSMESYGPRKAECDRAVFAAAEHGVPAKTVRPTVVYGPHDYVGQMGYWIDRVMAHDRVLVPGDGDYLMHRSYVEDVASALRTVAEHGEPGEAYNVGDRRLLTLQDTVELVADVAGRDVEVVTAGNRELAAGDLEFGDFPLVMGPQNVLSTAKLHGLGWEATPIREAMERTVSDHREREPDAPGWAPDRADEERVLGVLDTV